METKRIALIPAYEPDARLVSLAESMTKRSFSVLIVDDGSGPDYGEIFSRAASTASGTISTPMIFLAAGASTCAMVPVPEYRS